MKNWLLVSMLTPMSLIPIRTGAERIWMSVNTFIFSHWFLFKEAKIYYLYLKEIDFLVWINLKEKNCRQIPWHLPYELD